MLNLLIGVFIVLHGLVHLWFVTLSQRLVEFQPEMGWSGTSWLFSRFLEDSITRWLASGLYALAAVALVISGIGVAIRAEWWQQVLVGSAVFSSIAIVVFWDGHLQQLVEKGLLGLVVNAAFLIAVLWLKWPADLF
jgi:hypothetical protein